MRTPAAKVSRPHEIKIHRAAVSNRYNDELTLTPVRGAVRRLLERDGSMRSEINEAHAVLWANIGDTLIVAGPTIDETAIVEVIAVLAGGNSLRVQLRHGQIAPTTTGAHVLRAFKAPKKASTKRSNSSVPAATERAA